MRGRGEYSEPVVGIFGQSALVCSGLLCVEAIYYMNNSSEVFSSTQVWFVHKEFYSFFYYFNPAYVEGKSFFQLFGKRNVFVTFELSRTFTEYGVKIGKRRTLLLNCLSLCVQIKQ